MSTWLERKLQLDGPREVTEIVITRYENNVVQYQFTGLEGHPCDPVEIHRLLTQVRAEVERVVQLPAPTPAMSSTPLLEGVPV